jgi:heptosyltransferase-2
MEMSRPKLPFLIYKTLSRLRSLGYEILERSGGYGLLLSRNIGLVPSVARVHPEMVKKVLVIRTDAIGDIILTTPLVKAAKTCLPRASLTFLVSDECRDLIKGVPGCDRVIGYRPRRGLAGLVSWWEMARILRKEGYDLVLALPHGSLNIAAWARFTGANQRVGYRSRGFGWLFSHTLPDERGEKVKHEVENCLELLRFVGLAPDESSKPLYVNLDPKVKKSVKRYLSEKGIEAGKERIVLIHPGSRTTWVRWPPERFAQVADRLQARRDVRTVIVGGPGEEPVSDSVTGRMKSPALDLTGRLSLVELAALASISRLFIGHSTGSMHLAAATGIPVVAIFGPTSPTDHIERWRPYSAEGVVVSKAVCPQACVPKYCPNLDCMAAVQVDDVLEKVEQSLTRPIATSSHPVAGS